MQPVPYYQQLLKKATELIKTGEPISFIGMEGCGKNYLFTLIQNEHREATDVITIDLTGTNAQDELVIDRINLALKNDVSINEFNDLSALLESDTPIAMCINLGFQEPFPKKFIATLSALAYESLRNVNYLFVANTDVLNNKALNSHTITHMLTSNIEPILPMPDESPRTVLSNYIEMYGTHLSEETEAELIRLSGGHPGLLKSLYVQAIEMPEDFQLNLQDPQLLSRVTRILLSMNSKQLNYLQQLARKQPLPEISTQNALTLQYYGFLNGEASIFSDVLIQYLETHDFNDLQINPALVLSPADQKLLESFKLHSGEILNRDAIAQTLWPNDTNEKYSDWAIDQAIYSLRAKLKDTHMGTITTKRGQGYIYTE